ncbi:catalase [Sorangium sp. So ce394]
MSSPGKERSTSPAITPRPSRPRISTTRRRSSTTPSRAAARRSGRSARSSWKTASTRSPTSIRSTRRRSGAGEVPAPPDRRMALDSNPTNDFAEVEQAAFGTGVLVYGMDLLDDKLLQGRTFSYSDTQR